MDNENQSFQNSNNFQVFHLLQHFLETTSLVRERHLKKSDNKDRMFTLKKCKTKVINISANSSSVKQTIWNFK